MIRQRVQILVEVDIDPVPGWGDNPEDWRALIERRMTEPWYHPVVTVAGLVEPAVSE